MLRGALRWLPLWIVARIAKRHCERTRVAGELMVQPFMDILVRLDAKPDLEDDKRECGNCMYHQHDRSGGGGQYYCKRNAPERGESKPEWPRTYSFDWCGEHAPKQ